MRKKWIALMMAACMVAAPVNCFAEDATDYSYLEDMTVNELKSLRNAIDEILGDDISEDTANSGEEPDASINTDSESVAEDDGVFSITPANILDPLYDKDGIKVTVSSCSHDTSSYKPEYEMVLLVENNSDQEVGAYLSDVYINGFSVSSYIDMNYIAPGKKGLCESSIYEEDLEPYGIESIDNIECFISLSTGVWGDYIDYKECTINPIVFALNIKNGEMQGISDKEIVQKVQEALNKEGFDCGTPDGIAGAGTSNAIRAYQEKNNLNVDGTITYELLQSLNLYE